MACGRAASVVSHKALQVVRVVVVQPIDPSSLNAAIEASLAPIRLCLAAYTSPPAAIMGPVPGEMALNPPDHTGEQACETVQPVVRSFANPETWPSSSIVRRCRLVMVSHGLPTPENEANGAHARGTPV